MKPNVRTNSNTLEDDATRWVQLPLNAPVEEVFGPAHNIMLDVERSPKGLGRWGQDPWPTFDTIRDHVEKGELFGTVPSSFVLSDGLHLSALDVDRGDVDILTSTYPPLVAISSWQDGRAHVYYPDDTPRPNSTWSLGDAGGEVRSGSGYLAHYRTGPMELAEAIYRWPSGAPCVPFPSHLCRSTITHRTSTRSCLNAPFIGPPDGLTPLLRLRDVVEPHRHPALVRIASRWAGRRTWNGKELTDDGLIRCLWRLAIGMTQRLPEEEVGGIVGWAVSMRPIFHAMAHTPKWIQKQARRGRLGGRPRKWTSEAERLRAYRAANRTESQ